MRSVWSALIFMVASVCAGEIPWAWARPEAARVEGAAGDSLAAAYRAGTAAFGRGDFAVAALCFEKALAANPGDQSTIYLIAAAYAAAGDAQHGVEYLRLLAAAASNFVPRPETFARISDAPEYGRVAAEIAAAAPRTHASQVACEIPERDLYPEGIAFDPVERALYVGSIYKSKIVRVTLADAGSAVAPAGPAIADFARPRQDGLYAVLGMKVDARRRLLWVASSAEPGMRDLTSDENGRAGVFAYDLRRRALAKKYILDNQPPHLLNDLALDSAGNVYVTDTATGAIYRIEPGNDSLEVFLPAGSFAGPNGIAVSDDARKVFVGDWERGISVVDVATRRCARLSHPAGVSLNGPDGLYYLPGSLLGVYNSIGPGWVGRFYLNDAQDGITRAEVLDANNPAFAQPTTGTIVDDWFYYIANSQYASYNTDGSAFPLDKLRPIAILKLKL